MGSEGDRREGDDGDTIEGFALLLVDTVILTNEEIEL